MRENERALCVSAALSVSPIPHLPCCQVQSYLTSRYDMALQLMAFLDSRLDGLDPQHGEERSAMVAQRTALETEIDAVLEQMEQQARGQSLLKQFGVTPGQIAQR